MLNILTIIAYSCLSALLLIINDKNGYCYRNCGGAYWYGGDNGIGSGFIEIGLSLFCALLINYYFLTVVKKYASL